MTDSELAAPLPVTLMIPPAFKEYPKRTHASYCHFGDAAMRRLLA
jgi:hypothetical protein